MLEKNTQRGAASCPQTTGFTGNAVEALRGFTLQITPALPATVTAGATIRFFRRSRYELSQAPDSNFYLAWYDCVASPARATPCAAAEFVSGPYLPLSPTSAPGLRFSFRDSANAITTVPQRVARIGVTIRAQSPRSLRSSGWPSGRFADSLEIAVAVKNRI